MAILWGFFSVFPANAGMILEAAPAMRRIFGVPRECGDDPNREENLVYEDMCSPRMRG